ncbi:MAG: FixH family protein [Gemmatimonadetes bacterium]|nr:FixH family protein [Gemmatimonadota bacterium]
MTRRRLGKEHVWPTIVVVLLAGNVVVGVALSRIASRGASLTVEPDYYRKAVEWDSTMAQQRRNVALGWRLVPSLGALRDGGGADLAFAIVDSAGAPVTGAVVRVDARQLAHADEALVATLAAGVAGSYSGQLPMRRDGLWEVRVDAERGGDRFTGLVRLDASRTAAARIVADRPGTAIPARLAAGTRREPPAR